MSNKCRNDVLKYGYDSRKIDSVMAGFVRGGQKSASPCSFHIVLQAAAYRVKSVLKNPNRKKKLNVLINMLNRLSELSDD